MEASFDRWRGNAGELLDVNFAGVFDGESEATTVMKTAVYSFAAEHSALVQWTLEVIMRELLIVTRNQFRDFLPGGKFDD